MDNHFTEARGRQLAIDMMREIGDHWGREIPDDLPDEQITEYMINSEPHIMRRYLDMVRQRPELERGFLCVLSDVIGCSRDSEVDLDRYAEVRGLR